MVGTRRLAALSPWRQTRIVSIASVDALAGPYAVVALVLAMGGFLKASRPAPTEGALRALGLPSHGGLVRVLGAIEVGVGTTALVFDSRVAAGIVAVSFAAFAGFVALALRRGTMVGSCGCFGRVDTPPTLTHLVLNAGAAAVAAAVAARPSGTSFAAAVGDQPLFAIPFTLLCVTSAGLVYLALTRLPQLNWLRSHR